MFGKSLITLLTSSILFYPISSAWGEENTALEITFACEDNNGVPITVARNNKGQAKTIFYWKEEVLAKLLASYTKPQTSEEICTEVSLKLNDFSQESNLLSFTLMPVERIGLPMICAGNTLSWDISADCKKVLFILPASSGQQLLIADSALREIVNPEIKEKYSDVEGIREVAFTRYQFNLSKFLKNED